MICSDYSPTTDTWQWLCHFRISNVRFAFWAFFRKPEKLWSHTGSKWWPGDQDVKMTQMTHWTGDPVTQFHVCSIQRPPMSQRQKSLDRKVFRYSPENSESVPSTSLNVYQTRYLPSSRQDSLFLIKFSNPLLRLEFGFCRVLTIVRVRKLYLLTFLALSRMRVLPPGTPSVLWRCWMGGRKGIRP